jgi:hypothetical protein
LQAFQAAAFLPLSRLTFYLLVMKAYLARVPWCTTLPLGQVLNLVPPSTLPLGVFPLPAIGLCFQSLPPMPFFTASAVSLLTDPLLAVKNSLKNHRILPG